MQRKEKDLRKVPFLSKLNKSANPVSLQKSSLKYKGQSSDILSLCGISWDFSHKLKVTSIGRHQLAQTGTSSSYTDDHHLCTWNLNKTLSPTKSNTVVIQCFLTIHLSQGLSRWLSGQEHFLFLQRTWGSVSNTHMVEHKQPEDATTLSGFSKHQA